MPYPLRVELVRIKRWPSFVIEHGSMAVRREPEGCFPHVLSAHGSPLRREGSVHDERLQHGKEHNVALAASRIDRIVVRSGQVFSYHHAVGRPTRTRGFRLGLELHDGGPSAGVGGGCCQVSNLLYLLALYAGMEIVERHRHGLDLFPDHGRTVPFGCGATVFFNRADLRFRNPLDQPVQIRLSVEAGELKGMIAAERHPGFEIEVVEVDHRFHRDGDAWFRENRILRRRLVGCQIVDEQEVAHNRGRCLYDPEAP